METPLPLCWGIEEVTLCNFGGGKTITFLVVESYPIIKFLVHEFKYTWQLINYRMHCNLIHANYYFNIATGGILGLTVPTLYLCGVVTCLLFLKTSTCVSNSGQPY